MFVSFRTNRKRAVVRRSQRGDTIVEVLISITILSLILGGAYVTTNHSLLDTRDAQEHSNATKLIETQLEELRSAAAVNPGALFATTLPPFCMVSGSTTPASLPNGSCTVDTTGTPVSSSSTQPQYALRVTRTQTTAGGLNYYTFTAQATWDSVIGNGQDAVQMSYRLDQQ
ncbi:MAG TPA: prepilin-type N-terminal cleavage/methylation domain-containing protein [Candidatus Saccharimonadales bacterium]